ncbi:membrane protein of ER body-like protein [Daucus carota subsp. sativus]|uniref:membrane protein of ER body-like protein n=1 Tax=Daucus carota subsp. sativus TaxID=79200 RepID=UPI003082CD45
MEKAELKWQIEEEAPTIEDLQVRQCSQLPTKHIEEGHMKHVDINCEVDGDLVYALPEELLSGDNGALKFSQEELKEEVDPKCSERCVYYQTDEGLWKCRKCCWTYQSERVYSDDIQNSKQQLHEPTHFGTENQQESCFSYETRGTECTGGQFLSGQSSILHTDQDEIHADSILEVTKESSDIEQHLRQESKLEHETQLKHSSWCSSDILPSEISPEEDGKYFKSSRYKEIRSGDASLVHESDCESTELDVERVLSKQDTHDLYCPNCKSCITRRVIIRKRKRRLRYSGEDSKRNKLEEGLGSDPISVSVATTINPFHGTVDTCLDGIAAPTSINYVQDQEPEIFRCLSCFSIFSPTGNGFKLLRMFGDRRDEDNLQDHPQTPTVKKNWFSTLFKIDRSVETDDTEVGTGGMADVEPHDTEVLIPSNSTRETGIISVLHNSSSHAQTDLGREYVEPGAPGSTEDGTNALPHQEVSLGTSGGQENLDYQVFMNMDKQNGDSLGGEAPPPAVYDDREIVQSEITGPEEGGNKVLFPSSKTFTEYNIHLVGSGGLSDSSICKGKDEITVETCPVEPLAAQRMQNLTDPAESGNLQYPEIRMQINEQRHTSTEGIQGMEIIKSIIYGGLVELITSLAVVSSAAGSYVTTLNVFALGMANLIGGLFIIGHNLSELKYNQKTEASDQSAEPIDQYHELLGQRRNFLLHAVFAILSYLIFGSLPPVVYGFSFQKSDDRDLKLVAVAVVAVLGIIILAAGKAYVQRAPRSYVKTVLYYVVTALMASGVSYAAGNLINMFLKKFGAFQPNLVVTLPETTEPAAWASF